MRFKALIALIILLSLASCAKEGFSISEAELKRNIFISIDEEGIISSYKEEARLSIHQEEKQKTAFKLSSPDKDLVWEGRLDGSRAESDELLITPGASFLVGDYHCIFYGEDGSDISIDLSLPAIDKDFASFKQGLLIAPYDAELLINGEKITVKAGDEYTIPDDTANVVINYRDRYLNAVEVRQAF